MAEEVYREIYLFTRQVSLFLSGAQRRYQDSQQKSFNMPHTAFLMYFDSINQITCQGYFF